MLTVFVLFPSQVRAQLSDHSREQSEFKQDDQKDSTQALQADRPMTAEEVMEMLKERAREKLKGERHKLLLKTNWSSGLAFKFDTNPASDALQKGDQSLDKTFSFDWTPEFNSYFSGDLGYYLVDTDYAEQRAFNSINHSLTGKLKYYPSKSKRYFIEPGIGYEWNIYDFDTSSDYEQNKAFIGLTHYLTNVWSWGSKYEYSYKQYDKQAARNTGASNLNFHRADTRKNIEVWAKRSFGKLSVKLKEKSYRNKSNDEYQDYNEYDSHRGYIIFSGAPFKDGKMYFNFTSDYEIKTYSERAAQGTARWDRGIEYKLSGDYPLNKTLSLNTSVTYKKNNSNEATGVYKNVTSQLGLTASF